MDGLLLRFARWLVLKATQGEQHAQCTELRGREIHNDILQLEIIVTKPRALARRYLSKY